MWDFLYKQSAPIVPVKVADYPLLAIKVPDTVAGSSFTPCRWRRPAAWWPWGQGTAAPPCSSWTSVVVVVVVVVVMVVLSAVVAAARVVVGLGGEGSYNKTKHK